MKFKQQLKESLKDELTEEELNSLPGGFQTIGSIIIIKLNQSLLEKKTLIAEKYLELLPFIKSVYLNSGIIHGQFREPVSIKFLAGEDNPIVVHKEHGVSYLFDITKIMFSKGNLNERRFLTTLVNDGEIIVDMFAGIGYFSLPIAKIAKPKKIYSIELNPVAFEFLVKNIEINHLENVIIPINGDCKQEALKLSISGLKADRVIMGVFPAPKEYISVALTLAKNMGTIYHYEGVVDKVDSFNLFTEFMKIARNQGFKAELKNKRFVKSYGPKLYHCVLDILIKKN